MTREEYLNGLLAEYAPARVLSEKNGARVIRLRHRTLEKDLVLRLLPAPVKAYETLLNLRCDFLPEVYDVVSLEDGHAVLEEFIDGMTVAEALETGPYSYEEARRVMAGVLNALHVLHGQKIVHRDVKPENVMVTAEDRVVLLDFNASRIMTGRGHDTVVMGTVGYVSPEQLGLSESDCRTDVYAAGVLLNVMVTGCLPTEKIAAGKAGRIVKKCTKIHPDDRYQSAKDMLFAL